MNVNLGREGFDFINGDAPPIEQYIGRLSRRGNGTDMGLNSERTPNIMQVRWDNPSLPGGVPGYVLNQVNPVYMSSYPIPRGTPGVYETTRIDAPQNLEGYGALDENRNRLISTKLPKSVWYFDNAFGEENVRPPNKIPGPYLETNRENVLRWENKKKQGVMIDERAGDVLPLKVLETNPFYIRSYNFEQAMQMLKEDGFGNNFHAPALDFSYDSGFNLGPNDNTGYTFPEWDESPQ